MLKNDFELSFATVSPTDYQKKEIAKLGVCHELDENSHFSQFISLLSGSEIVVLDNYFFSTDYQKKIKCKGSKLVCIDDIHDKHFAADVVINHAGGIKKSEYSAEAYSQLFLGPEYAILRAEFLRKKENIGNEVLISMGGADKNNDILSILRLLENRNKRYRYNVLVGDSYRHMDILEDFIKDSSLSIEIYRNLTSTELSELMLKCDKFICPPSTISYEYLSLSGGEVYLKMIADNQKYLYKYFINNKIAFDVSALFIDDKVRVMNSFQNQEKVFDGMSHVRIQDIFCKLEKEQQLSLREAQLLDMDTYFKWVNDPDERKNAINSEPIPYNEHNAWFKKKIKEVNSYLWILEKKEIPLGQIRFEIDNNYATLSYFIDRRYRGKGYGLSIVKLGIYKLLQLKNNLIIRAIVRKSNIISCKIFDSLNFQKDILDNEFYEYKK